MKRVLLFLVMLSLVSTLLIGCAAPGDQTTLPGESAAAPGEATATPEQITSTLDGTSVTETPASAGGLGAIEIRVTDAPKYGIEKVEVYFSEVKVHKAAEDPEGEGEWISLPVEGGYFDLVELGKEGLEELLAREEVTPGKYTQIRVVIDEPVWVTYSETVETEEGEETIYPMVEAKLPSGELKFVQAFDVVDGITTIITLDFIVEDSVIFTGSTQQNPDTGASEPKVIVKPVVKLSVEQAPMDESPVGAIAGTVTDFDTGLPILGATVTVEDTGLYAVTGEDGSYEITGVPVGTYDVSATADDYQEATEVDIEVVEDTTTTVDFELESDGEEEP